MQLISQLISDHRLNWSDANDKRKALRTIGFYIKRLEIKLRRQFRDVGINSTRCTRATISFAFSRTDIELTELLEHFLEQFHDVKTCRDQCTVHQFILNRHKPQIEDYVKKASEISHPKSESNKGFIQIAKNLAEILQRGPEICSCSKCETIGDAIIALEAPPNMRLEHTDHAFDHLCQIIGQPHYKHPSESNVIKISK